MRSTSARYWLATSEMEMAPMVTFCLRHELQEQVEGARVGLGPARLNDMAYTPEQQKDRHDGLPAVSVQEGPQRVHPEETAEARRARMRRMGMAYLLNARSTLILRLALQKRQDKLGAVEGRQRDEVEEGQRQVDVDVGGCQAHCPEEHLVGKGA